MVGLLRWSRFPKEPPRVNFWMVCVVSLTLFLGPINSAFSSLPLIFLFAISSKSWWDSEKLVHLQFVHVDRPEPREQTRLGITQGEEKIFMDQNTAHELWSLPWTITRSSMDVVHGHDQMSKDDRIVHTMDEQTHNTYETFNTLEPWVPRIS